MFLRRKLLRCVCLYDHLVLAAPTDDITKLDTVSTKPDESTEAFKRKIEESCKSIVNIAENALKDTNVKSVTIMNHSPRFGTHNTDPILLKQKLANFANHFLLELWFDSPFKNKITIGSHSLECSPGDRDKRFRDDKTGHFDGIHMFGNLGKLAYTDSVINILLNSLQTPPLLVKKKADDDHNNCPQAKYQQKQMRLYSSVVAGSQPIKTQNRFSPLSDRLGN